MRSARWSARVLPDHLREASTRRRVAEVIRVVGLAPAPAGGQAGPGVLGLDAVAEPVRAPRRARLEAQRFGQPGRMRALGVGVRAVAVADLLGQVLGQVADAPVSVLGPGEHALGVEPDAEPGQVVGLVAELVEGLVPGGRTSPVAGSR